jgi:UPF0716 protein FxsA
MRRRGLALIPLALSALAVAEIAVFLVVLHAIGGGWALLLLAAVSLAGLALLRREGIRGWRAFRAAAEAGQPAGDQVSNSLVGLGGALLLALPGFITAVAGLILLLPPGRVVARRSVERFTERRVGADLFGPRKVKVRRGDPVVIDEDVPPSASAPAAAIEGEVIEGEVVR